MAKKKGKVRIGTSGWHYEHWKGPFYPEDLPDKEMLSYYVRYFSTVEMNRTFYSLPERSVFKNYCVKVPKAFLFTLKGSRFITHVKRLKDPKEPLKRLFHSIKGLGSHLGPILFQLPPHWTLNLERFAAFLKALPKNYRYSFEFRDPTWLCEEVYILLRKYNCAFCIYEISHFFSPQVITANFVYIRLHGPEEAYCGNYSLSVLKKWARFIEEQSKLSRDVYCYFDNDQKGYAAKNAAALKDLMNLSQY